ncbi:hypothetical protein GY45DRAFT_1332216 [Cubamyces sp. BRFM 1775]|nr:hypothetical protein GY45DRAFT_1332216 [Cubamyces sp. BRFM 1775]
MQTRGRGIVVLLLIASAFCDTTAANPIEPSSVEDLSVSTTVALPPPADYHKDAIDLAGAGALWRSNAHVKISN